MENKIAKKNYAMYHVGLKILLKKGDEFLFLKSADGTQFDLPGGRIDDVEHETPLVEILAREVAEELGEEVKYKLGKPVFQFRRHFESKGLHIFLTVYEAEYVSGEIHSCLRSIAVFNGLPVRNFKNLPKTTFSARKNIRRFGSIFREFLHRKNGLKFP